MGRIKDIFKNKDITEKLIAMGFDYGVGAQGEIGYVKTFRDGTYCLWVTVSFHENKLYLYNEFDCGGLLWKRDCDIPKDVLDDCDKFIEWLDSEGGGLDRDMNLIINIFIMISISVTLCVLFVSVSKFICRNMDDKCKIGALVMFLFISCFMNGVFICWLLNLYGKISSIF